MVSFHDESEKVVDGIMRMQCDFPEIRALTR
jgi:hypothetical protein